jgi:flagellar biosynthetic protein FlhB
MMDAVKTADVILLNPTHIAVALKYEAGKSAPRVVAKGVDEVAARIRENAKENRIPMVHDIPLARALHATCEVGDEIPMELYNAVATVLAFVFALKSRGAGQGVHKLATSTVLV